MNLIGNIRLGKDAELKYLGSGTAVANLAGVYEYGRKGDDGKKPSQWVDLALFGKQAEALATWLTKGAVLHVIAEDVHIETYQGKNGQGSKLVGKVVGISFAPSQPSKDAAPRQAAPQQSSAGAGGGGDFDDDIPFAARHFLEG